MKLSKYITKIIFTVLGISFVANSIFFILSSNNNSIVLLSNFNQKTLSTPTPLNNIINLPVKYLAKNFNAGFRETPGKYPDIIYNGFNSIDVTAGPDLLFKIECKNNCLTINNNGNGDFSQQGRPIVIYNDKDYKALDTSWGSNGFPVQTTTLPTKTFYCQIIRLTKSVKNGYEDNWKWTPKNSLYGSSINFVENDNFLIRLYTNFPYDASDGKTYDPEISLNNTNGKSYPKCLNTSINNKFNNYYNLNNEANFIDLFIVPEFSNGTSNSFKILVPQENSGTTIDVYTKFQEKDQKNVERYNTPAAQKFFDLPLSKAFNKINSELPTNNYYLTDFYDWQPFFMPPCMGEYEIKLEQDSANNRINLLFGDSNNPVFQYAFVSSNYITFFNNQRVRRICFSTKFYTNSGIPTFDNGKYQESFDGCYLDGFNKGTYLEKDISNAIVDPQYKNDFCSKVPIQDLQQWVYKCIGNQAPNTNYTNVNFTNNNLNPSSSLPYDLIFDNTKGQISFVIKLNDYLDKTGTVQTDGNWIRPAQPNPPAPTNYFTIGNDINNNIKIFNTADPTDINKNLYHASNDLAITNASSTFPSSCNQKDILDAINANKNKIFNNLGNQVLTNNPNDEVVASSIKTLTPNDVKGTISVTIITNNILTAPYALASSANETKEFTFDIEGFKQLSATNLNTGSYTVKDNNTNTYTSMYTGQITEQQLLDIIETKSYNAKSPTPANTLIIDGDLPAKLSLTTNVSINNITRNGSLGLITFDFNLYEYYDSKGVHVVPKDNKPLTCSVSLDGFKPVNATIVTKGKYEVSNAQTTNMNNLTSKDIIDIINHPNGYQALAPLNSTDKIINTNEPNIINNLAITIKNKDFVNGELTIAITLNTYFDNQGNEITNSPQTYDGIILSGFEKIPCTQLNSGNYDATKIDINLKSWFPNDPRITDDKLKEWIIEYDNKNSPKIISGKLPNGFSKNNIAIDAGSRKNDLIKGTISFSFTINPYYDNNGTLINNPTPACNITFYNFNNVTPTVLNKGSYRVKNANTTNPSIISDQEIFDIITNPSAYQDITTPPKNILEGSIPSGLTLQDFSFSSRTNDLVNGIITVNVCLKKYYDTNGNLTNNGNLCNEIKLTGFMESKPTIINPDTYSVNANWAKKTANITEIEIAQIILNEEYNLTNNKKIIEGSILFTYNQWLQDQSLMEITISNTNIPKGTITFNIKLNKYCDASGNEVKTPPLSSTTPITLNGFLETKDTGIVKNVNILNNKVLQDKYPKDIKRIFETVSPSPQDQKILDEFKNYLYEYAFSGFRQKPFVNNYLKITKIDKVNNLLGSLVIDLELNVYLENGKIIDVTTNSTLKPLLNLNVLVTGFKQVEYTHVNSNKTFDVSQIVINNYTKPIGELFTTEDAAKNNFKILKQIIQKYDEQQKNPNEKIICGSIPENFRYTDDGIGKESNLIIKAKLDPSTNSEKLVVTISLNCYYNATTGEIVNNVPITLPVEVTFIGFKLLPFTMINNTPILSSYFYHNSSDSVNHQKIIININDKSIYKNMTANNFAKMAFTNSDNTQEIVTTNLQSMLFYTNDVYRTSSQPLIVFNPILNNHGININNNDKQLYFDAFVINHVDDNRGIIDITLRAYGYVYEKGRIGAVEISKNGECAYLNIQLCNFIKGVKFDNESSQPYLIFPIIWIIIIALAFFAIVTYVIFIKQRKQKRKNNTLESRFILDDDDDNN